MKERQKATERQKESAGRGPEKEPEISVKWNEGKRQENKE